MIQGQRLAPDALHLIFARTLLGFYLLAGVGVPLLTHLLSRQLGQALVAVQAARAVVVSRLLAAGGRIKQPLTAQPWGVTVGWLADQFGLS